MKECTSLFNSNNKQGKRYKCPLIILPHHIISSNTNTMRYTTNNKDKWNITSAEKADEWIFSKLKTKNGTTNVSLFDKLNCTNSIHKKALLATSTNSKELSKENIPKHLRIFSKPLHSVMKSKEDLISKDTTICQKKKKMPSMYQSPAQKLHCVSMGFDMNFKTNNHSFFPQNLKAILFQQIKVMSNSYIERIKQIIMSKTTFYNKTYLFYYKIGPVIGRGAFGKINLCLHILSNQLVAIKSFNKKHKKFFYEKIIEEVHLMKVLTDYSNFNNPVVDFYEMIETETHLCIVMEYINGNDLLSLVKKKRLNEKKVKYIFMNLVQGLKSIHQKRIAHRDIKLENILISQDSRVKICDLGIAKIMTKQNETFKDRCGTLNYIAPEIIKGRGYNGEYADIWSCGIVLFTMLFGKLPYKFDKETKKIDYTIPQDFSKISLLAKDLIQKLLVIDRPEKRLSLNEILHHYWLNNATKISLFSQREVDFFEKRWEPDEIEFNEENIRTIDVEKKDIKNRKTKSIILAPFNTAIEEEKQKGGDKLNNVDKDNSLIIREKKIMMFEPNAKEDNMNYMINNNQDADNGVYVNENEETFLEKNKTPNEAHTIDTSSFYITNKTIMSHVIGIMEEYGYQEDYILNCIQKKEFNHATTTYILLMKQLLSNQKD